MREKIIKIIKVTFTGVLVILFITTLPAIYSNNKSVNQAKDSAKGFLDEASKICSSNCTDYPTDWIMKGKEKEAELYCMNQCSNNMEGFRKELTSELQATLFTNQYTYRVEQIYCILGLRCSLLEIENFVQTYRP